MKKAIAIISLLVLLISHISCQNNEHDTTPPDVIQKFKKIVSPTVDECPKDSFGIRDCSNKILSSYLDTLLSDGFDFPIGDKDAKGSYKSLITGKHYTGWYKAVSFSEVYDLGIHTGEDWNGSGGGDTDLGQPVYATSKGKVLFAQSCPSPWGKVIVMEHAYLENGKVKKIYSQYAHLKELFVEKGEFIKRRQEIGKIGKGDHNEHPAHLHFELRKYNLDSIPADYWPSSHKKELAWVKKYYENPSQFIKSHHKIRSIKQTPLLVLAIKSSYKMFVLKYGKPIAKYEIALSQNPKGHKVKQGDLKLPEGEYRLCQKTKGPFKGSPISAYFGPAWFRVSYPNNYDAAEGLRTGLIKKWQYQFIVNANNAKKTPPKTTPLGGGIGIHGWIDSDWENTGSRALTWGCISMHNDELKEFFKLVNVNTPIIITP